MMLAQVRDIPVPPALRNFKIGGNPDAFYSLDFLGIIVSRILLFAIIIAGPFFLIKLIMSGFNYLTSTGDPGKIQAASKNLINAALGLFVILTSFFIIQIIETLFNINIF
jgi:hypothetical protein